MLNDSFSPQTALPANDQKFWMPDFGINNQDKRFWDK